MFTEFQNYWWKFEKHEYMLNYVQTNFTSAILHVPQETIFLFTHAALWFKYQGQWADTIWPRCVRCRDVVTQFVDAVDVDDLTRPNSAILLKQLSGHMNTYWELLYHTENFKGCEKKFSAEI